MPCIWQSAAPFFHSLPFPPVPPHNPCLLCPSSAFHSSRALAIRLLLLVRVYVYVYAYVYAASRTHSRVATFDVTGNVTWTAAAGRVVVVVYIVIFYARRDSALVKRIVGVRLELSRVVTSCHRPIRTKRQTVIP